MIKGVIIAEHCYEETVELATVEEFNAYSEGLTTGANLYGAGGCGLYSIEDLDQFEETDPEYKIIKEKLG